MKTIRAGIARKTISPPLGIYLMGYGNRTQGNTGIHEEQGIAIATAAQ